MSEKQAEQGTDCIHLCVCEFGNQESQCPCDHYMLPAPDVSAVVEAARALVYSPCQLEHRWSEIGALHQALAAHDAQLDTGQDCPIENHGLVVDAMDAQHSAKVRGLSDADYLANQAEYDAQQPAPPPDHQTRITDCPSCGEPSIGCECGAARTQDTTSND